MSDRKVKMGVYQYQLQQYHSIDGWKEWMERLVAEGCEGGQQMLVFPEFASMDLVSLMPLAVQKDIHLQLEAMQQFLPDFKAQFAHLAEKYQVVIVAPSFPERVANELFNRIYVFAPGGRAGYQDKWWMTRFEKEDWKLSEGHGELTVFDTGFCKFGIQNCYDIEFAIGTNYLCRAGAEIIIVPSCTETIRGATRVHIGARARSMEFQCYTAVSQIVGQATWSVAAGRTYGYPAFYSTPDRRSAIEGILAVGRPQEAGWLNCELNMSALEYVRKEGQVLNFRDHHRIRMELADRKITVSTLDLR